MIMTGLDLVSTPSAGRWSSSAQIGPLLKLPAGSRRWTCPNCPVSEFCSPRAFSVVQAVSDYHGKRRQTFFRLSTTYKAKQLVLLLISHKNNNVTDFRFNRDVGSVDWLCWRSYPLPSRCPYRTACRWRPMRVNPRMRRDGQCTIHEIHAVHERTGPFQHARSH